MPSLNRNDVMAWLVDWRAGPETDWPPPVRAVEEGTNVGALLTDLGTALDKAAQADRTQLSAAIRADPMLTELRSVLAQLGAARALRLLHWLSETDLPEERALLASLLQHDSDPGRALRALIDALHRTVVLDRIFAPDRLAALEVACTETLKEDA